MKRTDAAKPARKRASLKLRRDEVLIVRVPYRTTVTIRGPEDMQIELDKTAQHMR